MNPLLLILLAARGSLGDVERSLLFLSLLSTQGQGTQLTGCVPQSATSSTAIDPCTVLLLAGLEGDLLGGRARARRAEDGGEQRGAGRRGVLGDGGLLPLLLLSCFQGQGGLFTCYPAPPPSASVYPPPATATAPTWSCSSPNLGTIALLLAFCGGFGAERNEAA